jgi:hypothetical protein
MPLLSLDFPRGYRIDVLAGPEPVADATEAEPAELVAVAALAPQAASATLPARPVSIPSTARRVERRLWSVIPCMSDTPFMASGATALAERKRWRIR